MQFLKSLTRIWLVPAFGLLLLAGGCGDGSVSPGDPETGAKRKAAREEAYGKSGIPKGTGTVVNTQATARQKAQSGR
jgi:hypothetical protein